MIVSPAQQEVEIVKGMGQGTGSVVAAASGLERRQSTREKQGQMGSLEAMNNYQA